jgi:hypothetical protein
MQHRRPRSIGAQLRGACAGSVGSVMGVQRLDFSCMH